ncbi:heparinase II/III family protein [Ramlibacter albus]|uniref:Heparinase II/III-family protein n=1 Tax=Ramlibacter albus TaxID=2079448 RepID=A0A923S3Y1_9BURK|nr:heparinase II/III-family protein [Ramlibacter albus]MBC5766925.1 heparinase II/III-family protein [Ramlibacter albus]
MTRFATRARTLFALGPANVLRVALYRAGLRSGLHPVQRVRAPVPQGPFFTRAHPALPGCPPPGRNWVEHTVLFGHLEIAHRLPQWRSHPVTGVRWPRADRPWWEIPDFDPAAGDVKLVWECSRMDWVLAFAQRAALGEAGMLDRLNAWLADWCRDNPPYTGPNWKCGQEASIRVMRLAGAALVLGTPNELSPGAADFVVMHLRRILPTVAYARAQDNNHGTSEACALFVGGTWLEAAGDARAGDFARTGRRLLEERVARLVGEQGTFSQYSVTYHRVLLDTLCLAEAWRRALGCAAFSPAFAQRAASAARWAASAVEPGSGDAPNVGANDGACLWPLFDGCDRDFRPSVQAATALFSGTRAYDGSRHDAVLLWLRVPPAQGTPAGPGSLDARDGGFAMLRSGAALALVRYPRFRFRPSQADVLHVDLWVGARNILRDAGTCSYSAPAPWDRYFPGTESHNTVQFDGRDQMPRLGRFLFGDWLRCDGKCEFSDDGDGVSLIAGYHDAKGAWHRRRVHLQEDKLQVEDDFGGFERKAVLRWRLEPSAWRLDRRDGHIALEAPGLRATFDCGEALAGCRIVEGRESRLYLQHTPLPVLEIELGRPGTVNSCLIWDRA